MHCAQPGMEQQRFIVFYQKMVELQIGLLSKDRDPIYIRCDFRSNRHTPSFIGFLKDGSRPWREKSSRTSDGPCLRDPEQDFAFGSALLARILCFTRLLQPKH